jgi:hypothetical protein
MSFYVEPGALERAAGQLTEAAADARAARAYISQHTDLKWHDQGIMNELWPDHDALVKAMNERLAHLSALLEQSRDALRRTAAYYQHTDARSAGRLDASYPDVPRGDEEMADDRPPPEDYP